MKLHSSVSMLKQLQLDITRMKSLSGIDEAGAAIHKEEKSDELSEYISDLKSGYRRSISTETCFKTSFGIYWKEYSKLF